MRNERHRVFLVGGERKQPETRKHLLLSTSGVFSNKSLKWGWGREKEKLDLRDITCLKLHKKNICLKYGPKMIRGKKAAFQETVLESHGGYFFLLIWAYVKYLV